MTRAHIMLNDSDKSAIKDLGRLWCSVKPLDVTNVIRECVRRVHAEEIKQIDLSWKEKSDALSQPDKVKLTKERILARSNSRGKKSQKTPTNKKVKA